MPTPHFIYVYDPLCGWCYGFSPVITSLWKEYSERATLEVVTGGMVRGDRVGPLSNIAHYIQDAYKRVEAYSGVTFGDPYLNELFGQGEVWQDSEPACLVHAALKVSRPELCLDFAAEVQKAIYYEGIPPTDPEKLIATALRIGADEKSLRLTLSDPHTHQAMIDDFNRAEGLGVQGFPTLLMELDNRRYVLTRGYASLEDLKSRISQIFEEEKSLR